MYLTLVSIFLYFGIIAFLCFTLGSSQWYMHLENRVGQWFLHALEAFFFLIFFSGGRQDLRPVQVGDDRHLVFFF